MNTWPELAQLELPESIKALLLKHLLIPFETEAEAKSYWEENSVQLVLSEPPKEAIPEYADPLSEDWTISLVILGGHSGIYYLSASKGELK